MGAGFGAFQANIIQFGIDHLSDASSTARDHILHHVVHADVVCLWHYNSIQWLLHTRVCGSVSCNTVIVRISH